MSKLLSGKVVSTKMDKTAVVLVTRFKNHPLYGKKYRVTKKYLAHDPTNQAKVGETVSLCPTRPISRRKHWKLATTNVKEKKA